MKVKNYSRDEIIEALRRFDESFKLFGRHKYQRAVREARGL